MSSTLIMGMGLIVTLWVAASCICASWLSKPRKRQ